MVVTVTNISEEGVTIDANHPMAGKKLIFDIEIINVD
jgi:FKBP-type peptidyl-prolyl cis-trans isomerase SlyD